MAALTGNIVLFRFFFLVVIVGLILATTLHEHAWYILVLATLLGLACIVVSPYLWRPSVIAIVVLAGSIWWGNEHIQYHKKKEALLRTVAAHGHHTAPFELTTGGLLKVTDRHRRYRASIQKISDTEVDNVDIILAIPKNLSLVPGQMVKTYGKVSFPDRPNTGFDYRSWLHLQGLYGTMYVNIFETISKPEKPGNIVRIRTWVWDTVHDTLPRKHATFLAGILVGERRDMEAAVREDFIRSGLMHIIAVSGFNITILIVFCSVIFRPLPSLIQILLTVGIIIGFTLIVGGQVPVLRASIMGLIGFLALRSGIHLRVESMLLLIFLGFVVHNPLRLLHDVSLLLSFGAVAGIIVFQKGFTHIFRFVPKLLAIQEALVMTLCALIYTLPISIVYFGQVSLVAPLANIFVSAAIPPTMLVGFLMLVFSLISESLTLGFGFLTYLFLNYTLNLTHIFSEPTWAVLHVELGVYRWYIFIVFGLILFSLSTKKQDT